ncbi:MAG: hypothetical protein NTZ80_04395 [Patescibacteria group bacterium]|nr:hypothetical protein [Patescibacteria group bacterium]
MSITYRQIRKEARKIIKDIYHQVTVSDDKELWFKALGSIKNRIHQIRYEKYCRLVYKSLFIIS